MAYHYLMLVQSYYRNGSPPYSWWLTPSDSGIELPEFSGDPAGLFTHRIAAISTIARAGWRLTGQAKEWDDPNGFCWTFMFEKADA